MVLSTLSKGPAKTIDRIIALPPESQYQISSSAPLEALSRSSALEKWAWMVPVEVMLGTPAIRNDSWKVHQIPSTLGQGPLHAELEGSMTELAKRTSWMACPASREESGIRYAAAAPMARPEGFIEAERRRGPSPTAQEGYIVTSLKAAREPIALFQKRVKLKAKHLALFCRQFAIMLSTGLSLVRALGLLEEQAAEPGFSKVLQSIRLDVASGTAFTRTLEKHRDVFPHVFIHLVEAGEVSGTMPEVLDRLATYYEREDELRKKISEALMYPAIITSVSFVMVIVLLFVVLPMLVKNFAGFGVETPAITLAVLNSRDWMVSHWYVVVGLIAALIMGGGTGCAPNRSLDADSVLLSVPALGEMQKW